MLRVGLTGGVACGKTMVAQMLEKRGAFIVMADKLAHDLMAPGEAVHDLVVERFGRGILNPDATINRARLAELAFAGRIHELNALVHPAVLDAEERWMDELGRRHPEAIAVCEAALLFEAGGENRLDCVIAVTCPLEQKVLRFAQRSGVTHEAARADVGRRMAAQFPEELKAARADYVIDNSGTPQQTETQVDHLWRQLLARNRAVPDAQPRT